MKLRHRTVVWSVLVAFVALAALAIGASTASSAIKQSIGSFAVDMPLSKPTTLGPVDGVNLAYPADPLKLSWRAVPGASSYEVQVSNQPSASVDCTATTAWQPDNVMLTYTTPELGWVPELTDAEHGSGIWTGTYCWRVRAAGTVPGVWSSGSRFTLTWTAQATNLRFYSDETGDVPRAAGTAGETTGFDTGYLEWDPVAGATQYEIQISNAPTFGAASLFAEKTYPATRLLLPQMPDNLYTWRVRPITSNGIKGSWSSTSTFRIFHDQRYWGGSANSTSNTLYPDNGATVDDLRIGWEPVPGAAYYRFMAADDLQAFTELENLLPYGTPRADTDCDFMNGRLSAADEEHSSTINNWVTAGALLGDDVMENLLVPCEWTDDMGTPDDTDDDVLHKELPDLPAVVYWRVYPVWHLDAASEEAWNVQEKTIYGQPVQRGFQALEYGAAEIAGADGPVAGGQCRRMNGPSSTTTVNCLRNNGGSMSPLNPSTNSTTMQVPVFQWGTYPGIDATKGPGSYRVQVAQDTDFVFKLRPEGQPQERGWIANRGPLKRDEWAPLSNGMTRLGGVTRSFAFTTGLPDEGDLDNNGYFWRAIPCQSGIPTSVDSAAAVCRDRYSDLFDVQWSPGIAHGVADSGALEFRKRVEVSTQVINGFTPSTPLLRVGPVGASTYSDWQRGIQGADHYEFELSRTLAFDESSRTFKTTVPRIVPWGANPADVLAPGTWFWRVRAVDRDDLKGSWSAASSFTSSAPAPTISSSSATIGVGGTVEWSPVTGAVGYEIEWSADSGFSSGVTKKLTRQSAYHIPASAAGNLYWRVRAQVGTDVFGQWTEPKAITILSPSGITHGVARGIVNVGQTAIIEGGLVVAGTARNGQPVELQRKSSSCTGGGTYRTIATQTSGRNVDDGVVRYRIRVASSACYRLSWSFATGALYSAPFEIGARPIVTFKPLQRRVSRGRAFCSLVTSRQPITGTLRIQYKVRRNWITAKTQAIRGVKRRKQCAAINRGGKFPVRMVLSGLVNPRTGWKYYEDVTIGGGTVKVTDAFTVIRGGR